MPFYKTCNESEAAVSLHVETGCTWMFVETMILSTLRVAVNAVRDCCFQMAP